MEVQRTERMYTTTCTTIVPAPADIVWKRVTTPEGINDELWPFLRMTVPEPVRGRSIDDVELGKKICRSWMLLFGFIPFEYDDIALAEREPGKRFLETSSMFSLKTWIHERVLTPVPDGCELFDRLSFQMRRPFAFIPGMGRLVCASLGRLFRHRHRRVVKHFEGRSRWN